MGELLRFTIPVFAIGALAFWWADRRISFEVRHKRWIKFATYIVIVHAFLLATVLGKGYLLALLAREREPSAKIGKDCGVRAG